MIWKVFGDIVTVIAIAGITTIVTILGVSLYAIHKHMMKD